MWCTWFATRIKISFSLKFKTTMKRRSKSKIERMSKDNVVLLMFVGEFLWFLYDKFNDSFELLKEWIWYSSWGWITNVYNYSYIFLVNIEIDFRFQFSTKIANRLGSWVLIFRAPYITRLTSHQLVWKRIFIPLLKTTFHSN